MINKILLNIKKFIGNDIDIPDTHLSCDRCEGLGLSDHVTECDDCDGKGMIQKTHTRYLESLDQNKS